MDPKDVVQISEESAELVVGGIRREVVAVFICENCGEQIQAPISDLPRACPHCKTPLPAFLTDIQ